MRCILLLCILLLDKNATSKPVEEPYSNGNDSHKELQQQFSLVAYVENFKQIMADYVRTRYSHLTTKEMEKVKEILEDFLRNFSNDLREILNGDDSGNHDEKEIIEDGISDATFEEINERVREEFKDISDGKADEIVFRLRKSLLATRQQLDGVIEESKRALEENSQ